MKTKQGPTYLQVLVCSLIGVGILALIWPISSEKPASRHVQTLSNAKMLALSALMYVGDYNNYLPDCPVEGVLTESYVFVEKLEPYDKNPTIARVVTSPYPMGSIQHSMHDAPAELGGGYYMTSPSDPCVGLPVSKYGKNDSAASQFFADVYPPTDFALNPTMWGYRQNGCPKGGKTDGYSHPGANIDTGLALMAHKGANVGVNYLGPGKLTLVHPEQAVLFYSFPSDNRLWPGPGFWIREIDPTTSGKTLVAFVDGHAKSLDLNRFLGGEPGSRDSAVYPYNASYVTAQNWNPPYDGHTAAFGRAFYWWGTQLANPTIE